MAIDWANEPFARLYKRETDEDLLLSWEARAVWHEMLKKADQSGLIESRRGVRGLAALIRVPLEVVERVLQELLEDGRIRSVPAQGFIIPNYLEANFTPRSNNARKHDSRSHRRAAALNTQNHVAADNDRSHDVTRGHTESREVTHNITDTDTNTSSAPPARDTTRQAKRRQSIPEDWQPRPEERALADELGLDCDLEAREFLTYWLGDGRPKKDWDRTFANRLLSQGKRNGGARRADQPRLIPEL